MNYIWDIILVVAMLLCIISTAKKGFIGACKNIVSIILTVVLLSTMHPVILRQLQGSGIGDSVKRVVTENVTKTYEKEQIPEETDTTDTEKSVQIVETFFCEERIELQTWNGFFNKFYWNIPSVQVVQRRHLFPCELCLLRYI